MPIKVLMPALSPTMEEGTLAKWTVKPGDQVNSGDVIAEIETDKATMEVEAVEEGKVGKLLVDEGTEGVQVNAPIAILLEEGEDESALEGYDPEASEDDSAASADDSKADQKDAPKSETKSDDKTDAPRKPKGKTLADPDIPDGTKMKEITIRDALRDAMAEEMRADEAVFVMGEEVAQYQGAYKVTRELLQEFGDQRVVRRSTCSTGPSFSSCTECVPLSAR